jgi:hypothetical protein
MPTLIHVRFSPDGTVTEIGARPSGVPQQKWFDHLTRTAGSAYQALAGGRGVFRVEQQDLDRIKESLAT